MKVQSCKRFHDVFKPNIFLIVCYDATFLSLIIYILYLLKKIKSATFQLDVFESMIDSARCGFYVGKILHGVFPYFLPRVSFITNENGA